MKVELFEVEIVELLMKYPLYQLKILTFLCEYIFWSSLNAHCFGD